MTIQLEARHATIVEMILQARLPRVRVLVFGSRACGSAERHSDLDVLIDADVPTAEAVLAQLELDFAESDLPFRVDVVDGARLEPGFRRRIMAVAQPMPTTASAGTPRHDPAAETQRL
jgi:type I restriction enzyme S subunit